MAQPSVQLEDKIKVLNSFFGEINKDLDSFCYIYENNGVYFEYYLAHNSWIICVDYEDSMEIEQKIRHLLGKSVQNNYYTRGYLSTNLKLNHIFLVLENIEQKWAKEMLEKLIWISYIFQ